VSSISLIEIGLGMLVSRLAYYNDSAFARTPMHTDVMHARARQTASSQPSGLTAD
jgi:hypothetical protein